MSENGIRGVDLFKIAGESISGWIPSWKLGSQKPSRQPFCSLMEERLLMWLEYHPLVVWYGRGDISSTFASTYKITTPLTTPFAIDYLFDGKAHVYLPDAIGQLQDGSLFIAEAGVEQEKRKERNQAKAGAARKVASAQGGVYWIGTETTLLPKRHTNLIFLHARRQPFPSFSELAEALQVVWPWGEAACVQEVVERLGARCSPAEKEAAAWKRCAAAAAGGHLLVDLANAQLTRLTPLICLAPDSPPILPDPLPSHLESSPHREEAGSLDACIPEETDGKSDLLSTFDDSLLDEKQREHFLRNLRAVEAVRNGATLREAAAAAGMGRSTLGRLVQRTFEFGQVACVPRATYHREREVHPAFQQTIRLLYSRPTKLSIQAITEHVELKQVALRLRQDTGGAFALPSYDQVRRYIHTLQQEPKAQNRKMSSRAYRVHDRSRLSFQGNWYVSPGLLNRLAGREFEIYYDRRDVSVLYLFVDGSYVGETYCPAFMGQRVSEWEAKAMRKADAKGAKAAAAEVANVRAHIQEDIETTKKPRGQALRAREKARQFDRQREEIHPSSVVEALESLAPAAREGLQLAEAIPDPEKVYSWEPLAIRYREKEADL